MAYNPDRLHTIEINWGFPVSLETFDNNWKSVEIGIYYISRVFGGKETPIYIGETTQSFRKRIDQHYRHESIFLDKRGEKFIRMGTIVKPQDLSGYDNLPRLLKTIESAIIFEISPVIIDGLSNISQTVNYTIWYDLHIINSGKRGLIPRDIFNRNHLEDEI